MLQGIQDLPVAVRWLPGDTNDAADALSRYSASIQSSRPCRQVHDRDGAEVAQLPQHDVLRLQVALAVAQVVVVRVGDGVEEAPHHHLGGLLRVCFPRSSAMLCGVARGRDDQTIPGTGPLGLRGRAAAVAPAARPREEGAADGKRFLPAAAPRPRPRRRRRRGGHVRAAKKPNAFPPQRVVAATRQTEGGRGEARPRGGPGLDGL